MAEADIVFERPNRRESQSLDGRIPHFPRCFRVYKGTNAGIETVSVSRSCQVNDIRTKRQRDVTRKHGLKHLVIIDLVT